MTGLAVENTVSPAAEEPVVKPLHGRGAGPDLANLIDRTPEKYKLSSSTAGLTAFFGLLYLYLCQRPIWHTDIWGHLVYGKALVAAGQLPATEPVLPLGKGLPFVDTAWLSQVVGYEVFAWLGLAGLQGVTAIGGLLIAACAFVSVVKASGSRWAGLGAVLVTLALQWADLMVLRPQLAGLVLFSITLLVLTDPKKPLWPLIGIPCLFALWSNLHGSFPVGLLLLAAFAVGRWLDVYARCRYLLVAARDREFIYLVLLLQLSAAATLLNPYGLSIYSTVMQFSAHPNLQDLTEWQPLTLRTTLGQITAVVAFGLAACYRHTRRKIQTWELLSVVGLGLMALWSHRMIVWWAPLAGYLLGWHISSLWTPKPIASADETTAATTSRSGKWTVVTVGLIWIFFGFSSLGTRLIHGKVATYDVATSDYTPVKATRYLVKNPPIGQVFNVYEWGDYLQWAGPENLQVFVNSHAHQVPREVWQHYMQIIEQNAGWDDLLDRYSVNTVILDTEFRQSFIRRLKDEAKWKLTYEDQRAAIFTRRKPLGAAAVSAAKQAATKAASPATADEAH